jgi:ketosteroid isomerase-like protein
MSRENAEVIRRWAETYNRGDLDGFLAYLHPRVVWEENHPVFGFVGLDPVYEGREGVRLWWEATRDPWKTVEVEIHEITPAGDDTVVVGNTLHGTGAGSGVVVKLPFFQVIELRDGKVTRRRLYPERKEALEAAGLEE